MELRSKMLESKFQEQSLKQQQQHDAAVQKVKYIHFRVKIKVWNILALIMCIKHLTEFHFVESC